MSRSPTGGGHFANEQRAASKLPCPQSSCATSAPRPMSGGCQHCGALQGTTATGAKRLSCSRHAGAGAATDARCVGISRRTEQAKHKEHGPKTLLGFRSRHIRKHSNSAMDESTQKSRQTRQPTRHTENCRLRHDSLYRGLNPSPWSAKGMLRHLPGLGAGTWCCM